jgi:zinc D-Ala-D-Ala carboxypeptidase
LVSLRPSMSFRPANAGTGLSESGNYGLFSRGRVLRPLRVVAVLIVLGLALQALVTPAAAYDWHRRLKRGKRGKDVKAVQVRVAGFYRRKKVRFLIDGVYGRQTAKAVKKFERSSGFRNPNGRAGRRTLRALNWLGDRNGSTEHFNWSEFVQNRNSSCSSRANAYAGTFAGGMISARRARRHVKRLMWRLEAVRRKAGRHRMGVSSGFRSVPYNDCIGGASRSQHLYGSAADNRVAAVSNSRARRTARRSQLSGIICYAGKSHNHFDLRIENGAYRAGRRWSWPRRDSRGRELDGRGRPCWGEGSRSTAVASTTPEVLESVAKGIPGIGSVIPSEEEVKFFEKAGEPDDLGAGD